MIASRPPRDDSLEWVKTPLCPRKVEEFCKQYRVDPLLAAVLLRRGAHSAEEVLYFLERDLHYLHNPFLLHQMAQAVERSWQAIERGERALVLGDGDVDGVSATVMLVQGLQQLGLEIDWLTPSGDGLSMEKLNWARERAVGLIFAVDCGSSNAEEMARAKEESIDVIVLDHHLPPSTQPPAHAFVNSCLPPYPFPRISSALVVGKFLWAMGFYQHPHFGQQLTLVHLSRNAQQTILLTCAALMNLEKSETQFFELTPAHLPKALHLMEAHPILWFDEEGQQLLYRQAFGSAPPCAYDLAPHFRQLHPRLSSYSLEQLGRNSRTSRYGSSEPVTTLFHIYHLLAREANKTGQQLFVGNLDLMALSVMADMMPLRNENRLVVWRGLRHINSHLRPGLRELLLVLGALSPPLDTSVLSRQLIPTLNAAGRLAQPEVAVKLLLTTDPQERRVLALQMSELNRQRRQLSQQFWHQLLPEAKKSLTDFDGKMVLVYQQDIPRGITGVLASRLAQFFNRPAVVVTALSAAQLSGSLRSSEQQPIAAFLEQTADLYDSYGGHPSAGGFRLPSQRWPTLLQCYRKLAAQLRLPKSRRWEIDLELSADTLTPETLSSLVHRLEPFGQHHSPPLIMTRGFKIARVEAFGRGPKSHLRFILQLGPHHWTAVHWNAVDKYSGSLHVEDTVDVLYSWDGKYNVQGMQLVVRDVRRAPLSQSLPPP